MSNISIDFVFENEHINVTCHWNDKKELLITAITQYNAISSNGVINKLWSEEFSKEVIKHLTGELVTYTDNVINSAGVTQTNK